MKVSVRKISIRVGIGVLVVLALIGITIVLHAFLAPPWVEPVAGVRLEPARPILRGSDVKPDSAFDLLQRAANALVDKDKVAPHEIASLLLTNPDGEQIARAKATLRTNEAALELARRAANAPNPQVKTATSYLDPLSYMTSARNLGSLLRLSAAIEIHEGDYRRGFDELKTALNLMDMLSRGSVLIHRLVQISETTAACQMIRLIALQRIAPESELISVSTSLYQIDEQLEPWSETYRFELLGVKSSLDLLFAPGGLAQMTGLASPPTPRTKPSAWPVLRSRLLGSSRAVTARNLDSVFSHLIALADSPYDPSAERAFFERMTEPGWPRWRFALSKDPLGRLFTKLTLPVFEQVNSRHRMLRSELRATAVVLAICGFEKRTHRTPNVLEELVPDYLPYVPLDPFDGKALRYRVEPRGKWTVYSVGPDQKDDHGVKPAKRPTSYSRPGDIVYTSDEAGEEKAKLPAAVP